MGEFYIWTVLYKQCYWLPASGLLLVESMIKLIPTYKSMALCQVGNGQTVMIWEDTWNSQACRVKYPELHSFRIKDNPSYMEFMDRPILIENFHLPLSLQAFQQLHMFQNDLLSINMSTNPDVWTYTWNSDKFSSQKAYKLLKTGPKAHYFF